VGVVWLKEADNGIRLGGNVLGAGCIRRMLISLKATGTSFWSLAIPHPSSCSGMFFGMSPSHSLHTIVIREIATSFLAGNQQKPAKSTVKNFGFSSVSIHGPTNFRTLPKP